MKHTFLLKSSVILTAAALAAPAWASGYHFGTQSVSAQSTANASAAEAADPSTLFYNPAGLVQLDGTQISANLNLVAPDIKYSNASATYYPLAAGAPPAAVKGATSGQIRPARITAVPHAYASHRINDQLAVGVGMYVPFGSGTEYQRDSVLRYNLNELGLKSVAIQPTVAYKINDQHAVALGIVAQHTEAHLRQYANFAPALARAGVLTVPDPDGRADGHAEVKGGDWGFGYNLAWMWDISPEARVGVNYRSKVEHNLRGDAEWHLTDGIFARRVVGPQAQAGIRRAGYVAEESANVRITTPESLSVHGMWKVNPQWNLYGDITWTRHSRFNRAELNYQNSKVVVDPTTGSAGRSNQTILNPNWRNTVRVSLGASYQVSEPLQLRFGAAYDQSPVRSANDRMTTLPDNDRFWLSLGAKYDFNANHSLSAAYSHIFIKNASANVNGYCGGTAAGAGSVACVSSRTAGRADFRSSANLLGVQYTYKF